MEYKGYTLDPFQEQSIRAIERGASVIAAAPTGSGKTLIAEYAIERAFSLGKKVVYTAPIKALSGQKFREFTARWPGDVGIVTGDLSINSQAPLVIMTTEIFRNRLFEKHTRSRDAYAIIFDEVHFLDDKERGTVWEESIIFAPEGMQIICLSATISNLGEIGDWMRFARPGMDLEVVEETRRPVPLEECAFLEGFGIRSFSKARAITKRQKRLHARSDLEKLVNELSDAHRLPALYFVFSRRDCESLASYAARHASLLDPGEMMEALDFFDELSEYFGVYGDETVEKMRETVRRGCAFHHAGLLPAVKEMVERMFEAGYVKVLFATETFALGVNMPARSVVFDTLMKTIRGQRLFIKTRDYFQMAGRAGRRGIDEKGFVHVRVLPDNWELDRVRDVTTGKVEPIISRISPSYSTILKLYPELGEDIYSYLEKSLHTFQQERRDHGKKKRQKTEGGPRELIRARLEVLRAMDYLRGRELTQKGLIASKINGFEILVTEIFMSKFFRAMSEDALNVLFSAIVNDASERRSRRWRGPKGVSGWPRAVKAIDRFRAAEENAGVKSPVKELDWRLWRVVTDFSRGKPFDELEGRGVRSEPGDLVRHFRLSIQLMKQTAEVFSNHRDFAEKLEDAWQRLNRDAVDAEHQLRMAAELAGRE